MPSNTFYEPNNNGEGVTRKRTLENPNELKQNVLRCNQQPTYTSLESADLLQEEN
tara:strand:+ start:977 stop:1141 length:165 start_codon:yes stop_codon:yes gene_type:complete